MKKLFSAITLLLLLFSCCVAQGAGKNKVEYLGSYADLTRPSIDDPAMDGFILDLFREGDLIFGSFSVPPDTGVPPAPIVAVKFDAITHQLFFRARMVPGCEDGLGAPPKGRSWRISFEFDGKLTHDAASGTLSVQDGFAPDSPAENNFVTLKRWDRKGFLKVPNSYAQWAAESCNRFLADDWKER